MHLLILPGTGGQFGHFAMASKEQGLHRSRNNPILRVAPPLLAAPAAPALLQRASTWRGQRHAQTGCSRCATRVARPNTATSMNWYITAAVGAWISVPSSG